MSRWLERAAVTQAVLAINLSMFLVEVVLTHRATDLPLRMALRLGACDALATIGEFRWETLVTACFLHDGIAHLGVNMLVLWQTGPLVERTCGSERMAFTYMGAGVIGNVASVLAGWWTRSGGVTVGASGAIAGLVVAAIVFSWGSPRDTATRGLVAWFVFLVVLGALSVALGDRVGGLVHIAGAAAGAALGAFWRRYPPSPPIVSAGALAPAACVLVLCVATVAVHNRTDPFAAMTLQDRAQFTRDALFDGRCGDARAGLLAVERLRAVLAPVTSLRESVEATCGHMQP